MSQLGPVRGSTTSSSAASLEPPALPAVATATASSYYTNFDTKSWAAHVRTGLSHSVSCVLNKCGIRFDTPIVSFNLQKEMGNIFKSDFFWALAVGGILRDYLPAGGVFHEKLQLGELDGAYGGYFSILLKYAVDLPETPDIDVNFTGGLGLEVGRYHVKFNGNGEDHFGSTCPTDFELADAGPDIIFGNPNGNKKLDKEAEKLGDAAECTADSWLGGYAQPFAHAEVGLIILRNLEVGVVGRFLTFQSSRYDNKPGFTAEILFSLGLREAF